MARMTPRKRHTILWLVILPAVYSGCVWWVANSIQPRPSFRLDAGTPQGVVGFSPDGSHFVTTDLAFDTRFAKSDFVYAVFPLTVWSPNNGRRICQLGHDLRRSGFVESEVDASTKSQAMESIGSVTFSPDGKGVAIATISANRLIVYDLTTRRVMHARCDGIGADAVSLSFSADSEKLAVCVTEPVVFDLIDSNVQNRMWSYQGFQLWMGPMPARSSMKIPAIIPQADSCLVFSSNNKWLTYLDKSVAKGTSKLWELKDRVNLAKMQLATPAVISQDGSFLVSAVFEREQPFELKDTFQRWGSDVDGIALSSDKESEFEFFAFDSRRQIACTPIQLKRFATNSFSNNNKPFKYRRWELNEQPPREILNLDCVALSVSATGRHAVAAERDENDPSQTATIKWRDLSADRISNLLPADFAKGPSILCLSLDGNTVCAESDEVVSIFGRYTPKIREVIRRLGEMTGRNLEKEILGAGNQRISLWNGPTGKLLANIRDQHSIGFSPDGKTFATQDENYNIFFWDIPPSRNWPLAAKLAAIVTSLLISMFATLQRIVVRFRRPAIVVHIETAIV